ncbi:MAG: molybdopterin-guanine dinucleotide biosynthesis protein B [Thermodesulfobacteriota bacterium]
MEHSAPPVVAIVGLSGSGKTTLLVRLIPEIRRYGLRVGTIKHHPHDMEIDVPGKDSWFHRRAGASATILSTPSAFTMTRDADHDHSPGELAGILSDMDIVLAEGYKKHKVPKIEVHRPELSEGFLCLDDPFLLALVTEVHAPGTDIPIFKPGDATGLARFLLRCFRLAL